MNKTINLSIGITCHSVRIDGGMGRYTVALIQGLNSLGIKPTIFTKKIDPLLLQNLNFTPIKINCKWLPTKLRDHYFNYRIASLIKNYQFDCIISSNRCPSASVDICGGTHIAYLNAVQKNKTFFDRKMISLERKCYNNSKMIVAHSKGMKEELEKYYSIPPEKIEVIYPPIDGSKFSCTRLNSLEAQKFREEFNIPKENFTFLIPSAGNHYVKGLDILQEYFNNSDLPITLLVAGRPVPESRNVKYIGFRNDMEKIYKLTNYTILASRYEAFGMVAIESVFCGTPVILSDKVNAKEIINSDAEFIFNPDSIQSLDETIHKSINKQLILENPKKLISSQNSNTEHVKKILKSINLI